MGRLKNILWGHKSAINLDEYEEAIKKIKELFLEVIGEDNPTEQQMRDNAQYHFGYYDKTQEIRKKVEEL